MSKNLKILVIRFHALGDVLITLPFLNGLRQLLPDAQIDLITVKDNAKVHQNTYIFNNIIKIKGNKNAKAMFAYNLLKIPQLLLNGYDIILDLQDDKKSKLVKFFHRNKKISTFEKFSPKFAGTRYLEGIQKGEFDINPDFNIKIKNANAGLELLQKAGYTNEQLILLNPAGFFSSRNWPLENYINLIKIIKNKFLHPFKILLLGDKRIAEKSRIIEKTFPKDTINLVEQTNILEAFALLRKVAVMVSEDSGLAHMAWVQGVKTVLMLGSTRADWTAPPYPHVINLTSSDLACGDCMLAKCKHGDVRCLTRYSPKFIFEKIKFLLNES